MLSVDIVSSLLVYCQPVEWVIVAVLCPGRTRVCVCVRARVCVCVHVLGIELRALRVLDRPCATELYLQP